MHKNPIVCLKIADKPEKFLTIKDWKGGRTNCLYQGQLICKYLFLQNNGRNETKTSKRENKKIEGGDQRDTKIMKQ